MYEIHGTVAWVYDMKPGKTYVLVYVYLGRFEYNSLLIFCDVYFQTTWYVKMVHLK